MTENSTGLVAAPPRPLETAEEREATFKVAKALADSGFFKDAKGANQALAKILIGRDLGLSPAEAMQALHVFDGKVEASADFHATRVKRTPGYDYSVAWIENPDGHVDGCAITFYAPHLGKEYAEVGISTFTLQDAEVAGIADKGVWKKYPRNMLFARAMSNGVAWFCPEVMGAVRVYSPGEVEDMAPPVGEAAPEMRPDDLLALLLSGGLDPDIAAPVCNTVRRAQKLGHAGHGNAATVEMLLRGQPVEKVRAWLTATNDDLDLLAGNPDDVPDAPQDALVVEDGDDNALPSVEQRQATLRKMAAECRTDADATTDEDVRQDLEGQAAELEARADALEADPAEQPGLEGVE